MTLPKNIDIESIRVILDKYNMIFSPISNNNLNSQLRPGELYFRATKDYCDCDTSLGILNRERDYQKLLNSKKVKTLKKKKWTESEIDEWIIKKLQKKPSHSKRFITENERQLDIKRWTNFIHDPIESNEISRIGILKHWYKYGLQNEDFTLKRTVKLHVDETTSEILLNLEEDVLYEFSPRYKF